MSEVYDPKTNKPRADVLKQHFILEGRIEGACVRAALAADRRRSLDR